MIPLLIAFFFGAVVGVYLDISIARESEADYEDERHERQPDMWDLEVEKYFSQVEE